MPSADPSDRLRAETAYLFRHALLRDAAYELQLPADRARLHALALRVVEELCGGAPAAITDWWDQRPGPHPTDSFARELAEHAMIGAEADSVLVDAEVQYLWRAACQSANQYRAHEALGMYERLACRASPASSLRRAALCKAGISAHRAGLPGVCEQHLRGALAEAEQANDPVAREQSSGNLANLLRLTGGADEARRMYDRAIGDAEVSGRSRALATLLISRATLFTSTGRAPEARKDFQRAVELLEHARDDALLGQALGNMANLDAMEGRNGDARAHTIRALELARKAGDRRSEGIWIGNLAVDELETGRAAVAEEGFMLALSIARETGDRRSECMALGNLADVLMKSGRVDEARDRYDSALQQAREIQELRLQGVMLAGLASVAAASGDRAAALDSWQAAESLLARVGDRRLLQESLAGLNTLLAKRGLEPAAKRGGDTP